MSNYELAPNSILKLTVDYPSTATSLDNYWIIQFTEHFTGKSYIAKYQYDSLIGNTITSSKSINSTSFIGCYTDSYLKGSVLIADDLHFEITPIEDTTISSSVKVPVQFNAAIIDNAAIISFVITPQTGLSASYQDGNITLTTNPNETIANDYTVTILAKSGVNQGIQTFKVSYVNEINVSNTSELRTALRTAAQNGRNDIIRLADGIYKTTNDGLGEFSFSDTEAYKLYLVGSSKENVILDGNNTTRVLKLSNTNTGTSFYLENITVQNGYIKGDGAGIVSVIDLYCKNIIVKNNRASSTSTDGYPASRGGGIYLYKNLWLNNSLIENNEAGVGGGFSTQYYVYNANITNTIIKNNVALNIAGGFYAYHAKIYNSIIIANTSYYSSLDATPGAFKVASDLSLINSLIADNSAGIEIDGGNSDKNYIHNTIFSNNSSYDIQTEMSATIKISHSYFNGIMDIVYSGSNNLSIGNLGFIDKSNGNYNLTSDSILRNAGNSSIDGVIIPLTDFEGNPRKSGTEVDIGPFEYQEN